MGGHLVLRADADPSIGTGHLMRCLALTQEWKVAEGSSTFVVQPEVPTLRKRLEEEGMRVARVEGDPGTHQDALNTIQVARDNEARWVVIDGYRFGARYQRALKESGLNLLVIDDYGHAESYSADIVLNQNLHAHEGLYAKREPYTRLLLGTRYALLRRNFLEWRHHKREIPTLGRKVLVTLGGSDPHNVSQKVIEALEEVTVEDIEATVVLGAGNPHQVQLRSAVRASERNIRLVENVANMPERMAWADVATSAGGITSWELAFMGLPSIALVLAENQTPIAESLAEKGVAINAGWYSEVSPEDMAEMITQLLRNPEERRRMSDKGKTLVDGQGAERVVEELQMLASNASGGI